MTAPRWQLQIRNPDLELEGEISDFTKLELVLRFNAVDSWVLNLPTAAGDVIQAGWGIVLKRDARTVLSGPLTSRHRVWNVDGDALELGGVSDDVSLEDRLARPSAPPYVAAAYDVRTGPAETVLKGYVNANLGPGATADRALPGLVIGASAGAGDVVTGRARFDVLGDLLRELALAGGDLGFRIVQAGPGALRFEVYEPVDRTGTAIFSKSLGNLTKFELLEQVSEANAATVGGGGEGTGRVFYETTDPGEITRWNRRIEVFRDRRDTTDVLELEQTADEELAGKAEKTGLSITPIDTARLAFLVDYGLGDRVTVDVDGVPVRDVLREVKITLDGDGETIVPTVGTPGTTKDLLEIFGRIRAVARKVRSLERR